MSKYKTNRALESSVKSNRGFVAAEIPVVEFDSSSQAFFDAVDIANGSLTSTEKTAIDNYVLQAKFNANAWWNDTIADYPMVGSSINSCQINLKTPGTFNGTFINTVAGDFTATGWQPNGATSYMNSGITTINDTTLNSVAFEFYSRTSVGVGTTAGMDWAFRSGSSSNINCRFSNIGTFGLLFDCYNGFGGRLLLPNSEITACGMLYNRLSSSDSKVYRNGVSIGGINTVGGSPGGNYMFLGARSVSASADLFSQKECAGAGVFNGLTSAQSLAQYTARQAMNTTLSRNV